MGEHRGRSHRAMATLICVTGLALTGCAGPGAVQSGPSTVHSGPSLVQSKPAAVQSEPSAVESSSGAEQPDPSRGPCGGALALNVSLHQDAGPILACLVQPLASGSPWPVSIRAAAQAFRDFTGETSLPFEVTGPFDVVGGRTYQLVSQGLNGRSLYVAGAVDADSGRVTSVGYSPRAVDGPGERDISAEAAIADAARYLASHSIDLGGLSTSAAPTERGWEITLERLDGAVGVPPRVVVTVNWSTGDIVSFLETRLDLGSPPAAVLSRAQAEAVAIAAWMPSPVVEDARLRLEPGYTGNPILLLWEVYLSGKGDDGTTYATFRVDALTGQIS